MLLALQLVLGFQLQAVQAVASPMLMQSPMSARMAMAPGPGTTASHSHAFITPAAPDSATARGALDNTPAAPPDGTTATQVVHTAAAPPDGTTATQVDNTTAAQPDCPKHSMPHDCCHASACQCQCVYTPGMIDLPALSNIATSVAVPSLAATQIVTPRIDEFLRPPIV